jgi:membrane associated rhomboid family serine protease
MSYTDYQWGPGQTPASIRRLIIFTCIISLFSALTNTLFVQILHLPGPLELLSLSWYGLNNFYLWQPLTYLFIQESSVNGITVTFLMLLLFNMYMLWVLGSTLSQRIGTLRYILFYLLTGIVAGLVAIWVMSLTGYYTFFAGPSAALLASFVLWTMCNPYSQVMLFFVIPMKTKWLLAIVIGFVLLGSLSQGDSVSFTFYMTSILIAYFYGLMAWRLKSPYSFTNRFDEAVIDRVDSFSRYLHKTGTGTPKKKETVQPDSKIFDFNTGEPILDDDAFIDAMLTKISSGEEHSLTAAEKKRMEQISARKRNQ